MSISLLSAALNCQPEQNLMPSDWPVEVLMMWCRTLALHGDRAFSPRQNEELYAALGAYVEKILSMQDEERLLIFRANSDLLFEQLVSELDEAVRDELISQTIHYGTGRVSLENLFHAHFPESTLSQECKDLDRK